MRLPLFTLSALLFLTPAVQAMSEISPAATGESDAAASLTPAADAIAALRKTVAARIEQANQGEDIPNRFDWTAVEGDLDSVAEHVTANDHAKAKNTLNNLQRRIKSDELKQLLTATIAGIDEQKNADAIAAKLRIETALAGLVRAALDAKTADDIDPLYDQLADLEEEIGRLNNPRLNRLRSQIYPVRNFYNNWQDVLLAADDGSRQTIRNTRNNLLNNSSRLPGVTRTELRKRLDAISSDLEDGDDIETLLATATLDNLDDIQKSLIDGFDYGWNNSQNERQQIVAQLDAIRTADALLADDRPDEALNALRFGAMVYSNQRRSQGAIPLQTLRDQWIIRAFPKLTGLSDLPTATPKESALAYARRLLAEADAKEQWDRARPLARMVVLLDISPIAVYGGPQTTATRDNPELAIRHYQSALLMEEAAQPEAAAELYREALKAGAPAKLQTKLIQRLRDLASPAQP